MSTNIRYFHGSEDSTDVDVFYVFPALPTKEECKKFCSADPSENRNIIVVEDGIVTGCYKGTPDEVNNSLYVTYRLHPQESPLIVNRKVERVLVVKIIRAIRIILSHISRSQYREQVKHALVGTFAEKLETLENIDFTTIDFSALNKKMSREDILKTIAFQIGQTSALSCGKEVYTKSDIAEYDNRLRPFLYRDKKSNISELEWAKNCFIEEIRQVTGFNEFRVTDGKRTYNCQTEQPSE